jgi:hypothetical protein
MARPRFFSVVARRRLFRRREGVPFPSSRGPPFSVIARPRFFRHREARSAVAIHEAKGSEKAWIATPLRGSQ